MARRSITELDQLLTRALDLMDRYERLARDNAHRIHPDRRKPYVYAVQELENERRAVWSDALRAGHVHSSTPRDPSIKGS